MQQEIHIYVMKARIRSRRARNGITSHVNVKFELGCALKKTRSPWARASPIAILFMNTERAIIGRRCLNCRPMGLTAEEREVKKIETVEDTRAYTEVH